MKSTKRISAALLLILITFLSVFPVSAASDGVLIYSTESNSGDRHTVCTTLTGTSALGYYTGDYTYDVLSELSGDRLFDELNELLTETHHTVSSYSDCRDMAVQVDCENNDGRVNLIYTSYSATMANYGGPHGTWNREHVWPKALGGFDTEGPGGDLHHIRPSDAQTNSKRGNDHYGNVTNGRDVIASSMVGENVVSGKSGGGYFEPLDNVKGDVARICLYVYARYGNDSAYDCQRITNVFRDIDTLLAWCELDPVDTWEMGRNEVVAAYQGNRNVFIDYPEYAWLLFDREVPAGMITPTSATGGDVPTCTHPTSSVQGAKSPTCTKVGYTGDTCCDSCKQVIAKGSEISQTSHTVQTMQGNNGETIAYCTVCGTIQPAEGQSDAPSSDANGTPTEPRKLSPKIVIIIGAAACVLIVGGTVVGCVVVVKKNGNRAKKKR